MNVFYRPIGFLDNQRPTYFIRILTKLNSLGLIKMDNETISALLYHRIAQTDYYYFESQLSNDTHRIEALNEDVRYSVSSLEH